VGFKFEPPKKIVVSAKALTTGMSLCGYLIDGVMIGFINAAFMHVYLG
jgi:hypothetical protein